MDDLTANKIFGYSNILRVEVGLNMDKISIGE